MSVALGDAFNRGRLDAFVTNISERGYLFQNNNLRLNEMAERGRASATSPTATIADAGWAWGAQFGDLNNDGANELFVANGFISADPQQELLVRDVEDRRRERPLFEDASTLAGLRQREPLRLRAIARLPQSRRSPAGSTSRRQVGATDLYDGRAVALADLSNRGAVDVIVANQNQPAMLYRDVSRQRAITGSRSSSSERAAIAARSAPRWCSSRAISKQRRVVDGGSGFASQNDRRLHFGLGHARMGGSRRRFTGRRARSRSCHAAADRPVHHDHRADGVDGMSDATHASERARPALAALLAAHAARSIRDTSSRS